MYVDDLCQVNNTLSDDHQTAWSDKYLTAVYSKDKGRKQCGAEGNPTCPWAIKHRFGNIGNDD